LQEDFPNEKRFVIVEFNFLLVPARSFARMNDA
jgi:hypothetical protein